MKESKTIRLLIAFLIFFGETFSQKKDAKYYFQKGEDAMDAQTYQTALAHFNECLRLEPNYIEAYYSRAQVREGLGDSKGALTDFNIYLESKPNNTEALFSRAMLRYEFKQWALAREDFAKLLTLPPGETKSIFFSPSREGGSPISSMQSNITSTMLNYIGMTDTKMKNYKSAVRFFDSAISMDSKNPELYINRGWAYQEMSDTINATNNYQKALSLNPAGSLARHNLAVLSAIKGNLKEVERLLTEAIEESPEEAYFFTARAINYSAQGDFKKALADYNSSIQIESKDPDLWIRRGLIKHQLKDLSGALSDFTQSLKIKDDNEKAWLYRGNLMMDMNRIKEAIEDYTIALTFKPEFGMAYYLRATAKKKAGESKTICDDLKTAESLGVTIKNRSAFVECK